MTKSSNAFLTNRYFRSGILRLKELREYEQPLDRFSWSRVSSLRFFTSLLALVAVATTYVSAEESSFGPLSFTGVQNNYFGLVIRSFHINPQNQEAASLNDNTPGVTIGRRYETKKRSGEAFLEGGVFYNSYEEVSPVLLAGYTFSAFNFPNGGQFRIGGFTGIGYYKELGKTLREDYGVPYYKGFIPLIGATVSYRSNRNELRLTTVPGDNLDAILNLSFARSF